MSGPGLFAYGSLASPESIAATLGHTVEPVAVVRLPDWRRRWSVARDNLASEKSFARVDGGTLPRHCLGLNLERAEDEEGPNGVLYRVDEDDLRRLDRRELRYDRTAVALPGHGPDPVFAYVAKREHLALSPPPDSVILAHYALTVQAAFAALGPEQLDLFRETTGPEPVEVVEGRLVRDAVPAGNPRSW
jgi:hypothetical protein